MPRSSTQSQGYSMHVDQQELEELGLNGDVNDGGAVVSVKVGDRQTLPQFQVTCFFLLCSERRRLRIHMFLTGTKGT